MRLSRRPCYSRWICRSRLGSTLSRVSRRLEASGAGLQQLSLSQTIELKDLDLSCCSELKDAHLWELNPSQIRTLHASERSGIRAVPKERFERLTDLHVDQHHEINVFLFPVVEIHLEGELLTKWLNYYSKK